MTSDNEEDGLMNDFFEEPKGYFQPEAPPHFVQHLLPSGQILRLRLVGSNPLWVVRPISCCCSSKSSDTATG